MDKPIPVICEVCRASGHLAEPQFAGFAELLDFTPVPLRAHNRNWTPAHQRGFIAALAITGSPNQAARAIGRYPFGAERLRQKPGGASFALAWTNALDLHRQRELAEMGTHLTALADRTREAALRTRSVFEGRGHGGGGSGSACDDDEIAAEELAAEAYARIEWRLRKARELFLCSIAHDPARRRAWTRLVGPVDWKTLGRPGAPDPVSPAHPNMGDGDMVITAQAGFLPQLSPSLPDAFLSFKAEVAAELKAREATLDRDQHADLAYFREGLARAGWTEQADGSWVAPTPAPPSRTKAKRSKRRSVEETARAGGATQGSGGAKRRGNGSGGQPAPNRRQD
ncbi:hypothetical protein ABDK56_09290 [Sphingomonas sp. ASV193]|uniref:hypothetical protein n=1 Tax=Sphingomonas sp. ASV193 TaxID=3144405 RepID=UPI0032E8BB4B